MLTLPRLPTVVVVVIVISVAIVSVVALEAADSYVKRLLQPEIEYGFRGDVDRGSTRQGLRARACRRSGHCANRRAFAAAGQRTIDGSEKRAAADKLARAAIPAVAGTPVIVVYFRRHHIAAAVGSLRLQVYRQIAVAKVLHD